MCAVLGSPCTAKTDQPERAQSRTIKMANRLQHVMSYDTKNKLVQPTEKTEASNFHLHYLRGKRL